MTLPVTDNSQRVPGAPVVASARGRLGKQSGGALQRAEPKRCAARARKQSRIVTLAEEQAFVAGQRFRVAARAQQPRRLEPPEIRFHAAAGAKAIDHPSRLDEPVAGQRRARLGHPLERADRRSWGSGGRRCRDRGDGKKQGHQELRLPRRSRSSKRTASWPSTSRIGPLRPVMLIQGRNGSWAASRRAAAACVGEARM